MVATEVTVSVPALNAGVVAGSAIDAVNGNKFVYSESTAVIIYNLEATDSFTVTIATKTSDAKGYTKTATYTVTAGSFLVHNFLSEEYQEGGYCEVSYAGTGTDGKIVVARFQKGN